MQNVQSDLYAREWVLDLACEAGGERDTLEFAGDLGKAVITQPVLVAFKQLDSLCTPHKTAKMLGQAVQCCMQQRDPIEPGWPAGHGLHVRSRKTWANYETLSGTCR